jgi:ankyrin repeat protein
LLFASFNGHTSVVKLLLDNGALPSQRDGLGRTALMWAATGDNAEAVELLLEAGSEVNAVDTSEGFTALMHAAAEGHASVVKVLLKHDADPAVRDTDGDTARDFATRNRHVDVVQLLAN